MVTVSSCLMCHAPIVIPAIGRGNAGACAATTAAMVKAAEMLLADQPLLVIVLSPHTPRARSHFGLVHQRSLRVDFTPFGSPDVAFALTAAHDLEHSLLEAAERSGLTIKPVRSEPLDHGAGVPLYFLRQAGWSGETVIFSFPYEENLEEEARFVEFLRHVLRGRSGHVAILASGDMSHRLIPGAPAGFDPEAQMFDATVRRAVEHQHYRDLITLDPELRDSAAEDVVASLRVACACVDFASAGAKFLSYEGPFGVGYMVAALYRRIEI